MKNNVGRSERLIRIILGIVILAGGFYLKSLWGIIGIIPLISGLSGFCPLYGVCGFSTYPGTQVKTTK